jgi:hypothetical protein
MLSRCAPALHRPRLHGALFGLVAGLVAAGPALAQQDRGPRTGSLRVGTCQRDITPISPALQAAYQAAFGVAGAVNHTDPIFLAGFGDNRPATGYHDRLWARGVVLDSRGVRIAIVALDLIGYFKNEIDTARALISPDSAIDFAVVASTHQHEGPDTLGIWGPDALTSGIDYGYLDFVNATIADCIDDAAASLEPARVYHATANSAGLSMGLDAEDDGFGVSDGKVLDGDAALAPATSGRIVDPNIGIVQVTKRTAPFDVIATLVNFGSHPESLGSNNPFVTSDFPHYVRERLEAEYGGLAIWVSGDLGVLQGPLDIDVLDPDTGVKAERRTFRFAEVHGTQLAERAIEAIDAVRLVGGLPNPSNGEPAPKLAFSTVDPVAVPLDNPFFRFFIALGVLDVRRQLFTNGVPDPSIGTLPPPAAFLPAAAGEDLHTEASAVQIGRSAIAVVPVELDPQIGFGYRDALVAQTGAAHTLIAGLANDEIGYQVPFAKWDDSCHACASYIILGVPELCPLAPDIDCNTVFQNNVGQQVDPSVSGAVLEAIDGL